MLACCQPSTAWNKISGKYRNIGLYFCVKATCDYFVDIHCFTNIETSVALCHKINSASADGGPRSQVCARETLRETPHRH